MRRATNTFAKKGQTNNISIHALLAESDEKECTISIHTARFLSTLSLRRATFPPQKGFSCLPIISIHALLAESDHQSRAVSRQKAHFYPRSPCGERLVKNHVFIVHNLFLSTLSLRRATVDTLIFARSALFLSTLSLRRATKGKSQANTTRAISIHALLAESDRAKSGQQRSRNNFYPRSPCGERPKSVQGANNQPEQFLSTLSLRRATSTPTTVLTLICISIHALLAESDRELVRLVGVGGIFLSTLSLRRATGQNLVNSVRGIISIHALLAESDAVLP